MTLEQLKLQELEKIQLEIDRTEDNLVYWMHEIIKDSIAEVEDSHINLTDEQLKKITEKLTGNLIFDVDDDDGGSFEYLSGQVKKLRTLHKDFDYLNS